MRTVPAIVDRHRELAITALDSLSWQFASSSRLLAYGDDRQAVEGYRRAIAIVRDYLSPDMRVIADSLEPEVVADAQPAKETEAAP